MAVQEPFLLYLRSRLNVTVVVVSLAVLAAALREHGSMSEAAKALGISRRALYDRLHRYGLRR